MSDEETRPTPDLVDSLDDEIAESMKDPEYAAAFNAADQSALDDGEDPTEFVGDFTTPDVDLTDLLGDDQQDQDETPTSHGPVADDELPAHIAEPEQTEADDSPDPEDGVNL